MDSSGLIAPAHFTARGPTTPNDDDPQPVVIVLMGVSGAGKTTVGHLLAATIGADFIEGDQFHPPASIEKMRSGVALDDTDRRPWLAALARQIGRWSAYGGHVVLACSALKRRYRDQLRQGRPEVHLIHLAGSEAMIRARLERRAGHYMPPGLLASQFAALEAPGRAEGALTVDVADTPDRIVAAIVRRLEPA